MALHLRGAIPAMPLLLDADRRVDWRAQRAVVRYHLASGADGLAVGVHSTQFELHDDPALLRDVWQLAHDEARACGREVTLVAGLVGPDAHAEREAAWAREVGFDVVLLSNRNNPDADEAALVDRFRRIGEVLPTIGFYLQESVGGRYLSAAFWRGLADLETCVGVKTAPFDRYRTREVARAVLESDRWNEVALLTGNDDTIVADLLTEHRIVVAGQERRLRFAGGLLGQYAVGTRAATELTHTCLDRPDAALLAVGQDLTEVNAAVFDVRHGFAGCVAGVNEVLRQQGLAVTALCLTEAERLSPGQSELIARVRADHPDLMDEAFLAEHRDAWLS